MKDLRIEIDDKSGFCFGVVRSHFGGREGPSQGEKQSIRWATSSTTGSKCSGSKSWD